MFKLTCALLLAFISCHTHAAWLSQPSALPVNEALPDVSGRTFGQPNAPVNTAAFKQLTAEQQHNLMVRDIRNGNIAQALALAPFISDNAHTHFIRQALKAAADIQAYRLNPANEGINGLQPSNTDQQALKSLLFILLELSRNNPQQALSHAETLEKQDPLHAYAFTLKGVALAALHRPEQAQAAFERALQLQPNLAAAYINAGFNLLQQQQYPAAMAQFQKALAMAPQQCSARLGLSFAYQQQSLFGEAYQVLAPCLSHSPAATLQQAQLLLSLAQPQKAWDALRTLAPAALSPSERLLGAKMALSLDKTEIALQWLSLNPAPSAEEDYWLAIAHLAANQPNRAVTLFNRLHSQNNRFVAALLGATISRLATGERPTEAHLQPLRAEPATRPFAELLTAASLAQLQPQQALAAFQRSASVVQGVSYEQVPSSALEQQLPHLTPLILGLYFYQLEAPLLAQKHWQTHSHKGFALAYFSGLAHFGQQHFTAAETQFQHSLSLAKPFFSARYMLGETYLRQGKTQEAEAHYQQALSLKKDPGLLLKAGLLAERNGQLSLAETRLNELVTLTPNNPIALNQLAWFYASHQLQLDKGISLAQKALQLSPNDSNFLDTLGWLYFQQGQLAKALSTLQQAHQLAEGKSQSIAYHLAKVYQRQGHKKPAEEALTIALNSKEEGYRAALLELQQQLHTQP